MKQEAKAPSSADNAAKASEVLVQLEKEGYDSIQVLSIALFAAADANCIASVFTK